MNTNLRNLAEILAGYGAEIKYNEPMSRHTTFRIGGSAALYIIPHSCDELRSVLSAVKSAGCKSFILGNGSNVVFPDKGYEGAVIATSALDKIGVSGERLICGAGVSLTQAAKTARDHSLSGLEFANGIPGSCGGAVFMNAGAYNGEISQILETSTYVSAVSGGELCTIFAAEHCFGYRESVYRHNPDRIITEAVFKLKQGDSAEISETMNDLMNRRVSKQPLEYPSAGSVFKRYPGRFTAQMIDEAGLKGFSVGGAQVSEKHAGFIINTGDASCNDVKTLVEYIRSTILEKFGCELECEIIFAE